MTARRPKNVRQWKTRRLVIAFETANAWVPAIAITPRTLAAHTGYRRNSGLKKFALPRPTRGSAARWKPRESCPGFKRARPRNGNRKRL